MLGEPSCPISQLFGKQADTAKNAAQDSPASFEGQTLLQQAIVALETQESIAAKIHYHFDLFDGLSLEGSGIYLAQTTQTGQLFRWDMTLSAGSLSKTWQEIFDGQNLWLYQARQSQENQQKEETLSRVDVLQVAQHLKKQGRLPKIGEIGDWPGLGGLARVLRSLQNDFQFVVLEKTSFRTSDGRQTRTLPAWKLLGTWKPPRLAQLLPDQADRIHQGLPVRWENVPPQLPDHVLIFLGQEDLFPYEIHYRRAPTGRGWSRLAEWLWFQPADRTLAKLECVELNLNGPVPADGFRYPPPPHLSAQDATQDFIQQLQKKMKP